MTHNILYLNGKPYYPYTITQQYNHALRIAKRLKGRYRGLKTWIANCASRNDGRYHVLYTSRVVR